MSNEKSRDALGEAAIPQRNNPAVDVSSGSPLDMVLWVIAFDFIGWCNDGKPIFTSVLGTCE